jgi:nitroreductase
MQLREFYHFTDRELINKMAHASLSQPAVSTANQLEVFVTRQDLHRRESKQIIEFERENIVRNSPAGSHSRRVKKMLKLPAAAEINMIISCGYRDGNKGIWGERFRVPFEDVYTQLS